MNILRNSLNEQKLSITRMLSLNLKEIPMTILDHSPQKKMIFNVEMNRAHRTSREATCAWTKPRKCRRYLFKRGMNGRNAAMRWLALTYNWAMTSDRGNII